MPQISIIMSVYNENPAFLHLSIESILNQQYGDFEFIIVDDGSDNDTAEILREYEKSDRRIRILRNKDNIGLTKSLNLAIIESSSPILARMDSDDIALPDRLGKQILFLSHGKFDLIGSNSILIDEYGNDIGIRSSQSASNIKSALMKGNFFTHSTFLGKRKIFHEYYNEHYKKAQDYEFLLRTLGSKYRIGYMNEPTLKYRVHSSGISEMGNQEQEWYALRARCDALLKYGYSSKYFPYIIRSFFIMLLPYGFKRSLMRTRK